MEQLQGVSGRIEAFSVCGVAVNEIKEPDFALPVVQNHYRWSACVSLSTTSRKAERRYAASHSVVVMWIIFHPSPPSPLLRKRIHLMITYSTHRNVNIIFLLAQLLMFVKV